MTDVDDLRTAAQRIVDAHNSCIGSSLEGGQLVFRRDGSGGEWYSAGCYGFGRHVVVIPVSHRRLSAAAVQCQLDLYDRRHGPEGDAYALAEAAYEVASRREEAAWYAGDDDEGRRLEQVTLAAEREMMAAEAAVVYGPERGR